MLPCPTTTRRTGLCPCSPRAVLPGRLDSWACAYEPLALSSKESGRAGLGVHPFFLRALALGAAANGSRRTQAGATRAHQRPSSPLFLGSSSRVWCGAAECRRDADLPSCSPSAGGCSPGPAQPTGSAGARVCGTDRGRDGWAPQLAMTPAEMDVDASG